MIYMVLVISTRSLAHKNCKSQGTQYVMTQDVVFLCFFHRIVKELTKYIGDRGRPSIYVGNLFIPGKIWKVKSVILSQVRCTLLH